MTSTWTVTDTPVADDTAKHLLRRYMLDVATSFYGRRPTDAEFDAALAEHPNGDLEPPRGLFLVAWHDGVPAGCVGVRFGPAGFAELKRMFVAPDARGLGGAAVLLAAAEQRARTHGVRTMRLETRLDLLAARSLYTKHGYREVPAFASDDRYAQCWYAKDITEDTTEDVTREVTQDVTQRVTEHVGQDVS